MAARGVRRQEAEELVAALESLGARVQLERADTEAPFVDSGRRLFTGGEDEDLSGSWNQVLSSPTPPSVSLIPPPVVPHDPREIVTIEPVDFASVDVGGAPPIAISGPPPRVAARSQNNAYRGPFSGSTDDDISIPPPRITPPPLLGKSANRSDSMLEFATRDTAPVDGVESLVPPSRPKPRRSRGHELDGLSGPLHIPDSPPILPEPVRAPPPRVIPAAEGEARRRPVTPARVTGSTRGPAERVEIAAESSGSRPSSMVLGIAAVAIFALLGIIMLRGGDETTEMNRSETAMAPSSGASPAAPGLADGGEADGSPATDSVGTGLTTEQLLDKGKMACRQRMFAECERILYEVIRRDPNQREAYDLLVEASLKRQQKKNRTH